MTTEDFRALSGRSDLADALRLAVARLGRRLRQQALGGLTPQQRSVLATISRYGPLSLSDLADLERVSRPSVSGVVKRLELQGNVARAADPADGRSTKVTLTEKGLEVLTAGRSESAAFLASRMAGMDPAELAILAQAIPLLTRMAEEE